MKLAMYSVLLSLALPGNKATRFTRGRLLINLRCFHPFPGPSAALSPKAYALLVVAAKTYKTPTSHMVLFFVEINSSSLKKLLLSAMHYP